MALHSDLINCYTLKRGALKGEEHLEFVEIEAKPHEAGPKLRYRESFIRSYKVKKVAGRKPCNLFV